ncbi:MAG TPA: CDP-glycerol glycerophosphotransferase family protein [Microlunatus sp.]
MPLVSVIIPVRNAGRYLRSCLDSVRRQSHLDLQVVCVDDGSSDQSAAVLEEHSDADARFQTIRQPHAGPGSARNVGLAHALGDYIMFVDADDLVPPEAVERHLNALRTSTSDFSTGRVLRISGTCRWPSMLHENGLSWPATGTHIFKDPALVFDTTSWNKLFRRDYWTGRRYAFPEHVMFEDVALMTETHCRASAVEVLADVVYLWRRRDDGTASITMRRDDPDLLRDRVASLQRVRRLLSDDAAPTPVRTAAEFKFLRYDLGSYFRELEDTQHEFQDDFVHLVQGFLDGSPGNVVDRLAPHLRVAYRLVSLGRRHELMDYLGFLRENDWRLPFRRRGLVLRADLGPARKSVHRSYRSARRRLPLSMGVDALSWQGDALVIEGYGFIDGMAMNHPAASVRRLQLIDARGRQERHVWIGPRRLPAVDRRGWSTHAYDDWSGFRAEIPMKLLDPGAARTPVRWQVNLQVLALGAGSGSALGPPSGSAFTEVKHGPRGLVLRVSWAAGQRLVIEAARASVALAAVESVGGLLSLSLRSVSSLASRPHTLRLTSEIGDAVDVPLSSAVTETGATFRATVDPVLLQMMKGARRHLSFCLAAVADDGVAAVTTQLPHEFAVPLGNHTVAVADDGRGGAEIVIGAPGVAITATTWIGDRLQVRGICWPSDQGPPRLAWCHGAGSMIQAVAHRNGHGFEATFELVSSSGPEGVHPLAAGEWTLMQGLVDGSWEPAVILHERPVTSVRSPSADVAGVRIGVNSHRQLAMSVTALGAAESSSHGQDRLRRGTYRRARRASVRDVILVESWGGRKFSDNPRALIESIPAAWRDATVVVVVSDRSVQTPGGLSQVIAGSRDYYEHLARARLIISNDSLPVHYVKRPGQLYLQTWHGTPLKRIGLDIERIRFRNKNYLHELRVESANWDGLVSQNSYSSEIFRRAFAFDGPIIESGYPRNDLLTDPNGARRLARRDITRRWLNIGPDQTVVLWAPTWRDDAHAPGGGYGTSLLLERSELEALVPGNTVVLVHGHHLTGAAQTHLGYEGQVRDVSSYPDLRDLIVASDALVTDYSSIMFDYALTGRPMIFFVPDLLHYQQIRGLYLDLASVAPGPLVSTADGLADALRSLSALGADHREAIRDFREQYCPLDDGQAAERVWAAVSDLSRSFSP